MFNLLGKLKLHRAREVEAAARVTYTADRLAYQDAYLRRDSRDKHRTYDELTVAARSLLKAENAARELARSVSARTPKRARTHSALTFQGRH